MIREFGAHVNFADRKLHLLQFFDRDIAGQILQADREEGSLHLSGENRREPGERAFIPKDAYEILVLVGGKKERQPLDVVPMGVRDQEREVDGAIAEFLLEREAEQANSGAGI